MAAQLTKQDRELIKEFRDNGVLQNIDDHRIDQSNGVILIACPDGDRFHDIFQHQVRMQTYCRSEPRIHTFGWHGGMIACVPGSPVNSRKDAHRVFLDQITAARAMKEIHAICGYAHAPCGAAHHYGLNIEQCLALQFTAKAHMKSENPGVEVSTFFHVDYGNGRRRSYFLSRTQWGDYLTGNKSK